MTPSALFDDARSPFHAGERAAQTRAGVRDRTEQLGRRMIRDHLPAQHRDFLRQLPLVVLAAVDGDGRPWASPLAGPPGFAHAPDPKRLRLDAQLAGADPLAGWLDDDAPLGLLAIELHTRRRNRANGRVRRTDAGLELQIGQAFGNCPRYIHPRTLVTHDGRSGCPCFSAGLTEPARALIAAADTVFIATVAPVEGDPADPRRGADASHRAGPAGFVQVEGDRLTFRDYAGNGHFNTIGNLMLEPRVGLTFVDFATGDLLQVTGAAEVQWDGDGRERTIYVRVEATVLRPAGLPLRLAPPEAQGWRDFAVARVEPAGADVRSLYLVPADQGALAPFTPGQHITVRVPTADGPVLRSYSLSRAYDGRAYRISVKRVPDGRASTTLHALLPGDRLALREPSGDFVLDRRGDAPVLLLAAGVGITPLMPMLQALAGGPRPVLLVHGCRDGARHPLRDELGRLADFGARVHVAYSRPRAQDAGLYDSVGRIDGPLLARLGVDAAWQAYVCGPAGFVGAALAALEGLGLVPDALFAEDFGRSALRAPATR